MQRVSRACQARHIAFLFPKAFQDYPDFGDDVDLLVLTRSTRVDGGIIEGLPASPVPRDCGERIAGAVTYRVTGYPSPLDVQHGRLGIVGEHDAFPQVLIEHARVTVVEGIEFAEPPPEDQLVLQGMQRVAGRLRIALCDVVFTVSTLRRATLDWDYVIATARQHGALPDRPGEQSTVLAAVPAADRQGGLDGRGQALLDSRRRRRPRRSLASGPG